MRLATVYRDDDNVAAMLVERDRDFRAALERTGGRREWGVKVYAAPPAGQTASSGERGRTSAGSGAEYLRRKRQKLSAAQDARRAGVASADAIHAALCQLSAGARLHPPQSSELTGSSTQMILNGAYLLDAGRDDELTAAVTALARQHPAVQVELTGPWPPYSFTGLAQEQDRS
jgi:Gas vesicle synthesis protein GvpL/GvpF